MSTLYIVIGVGVVVVLWIIGTYNGFVKRVQQTKEAWADIDVQLRRRYDLIPNLVETVKGYMAHERETLDAVISARAEATKVHVDVSNLTPEALASMTSAENALSASLGKLIAVAEGYPDLKASANFVELQRELSDTENKIQAARRFYNTNARDLKIKLGSFPASIIGSMFNFKEEPYFELAEGAKEREPVAVSF